MLSGMGVTNLTFTLSKRYARLSGEIIELEKKVEEVERLHRVLPEMRAQIAEKKDSLVHIAAVMRDANPEWRADEIKPTKPWRHEGPFPQKECTRRALEILAEHRRWMSVKEVVLILFEQFKIEHDPLIYQKTASNVGAGFRKRLGTELEMQPGPVQRWRVASKSAAEK